MLRKVALAIRQGFGRIVLGKSRIEQMSSLELQRRLRELERQKQQFKGKMDESKENFDELVSEAEDADPSRVPELEMEASVALQRYEAYQSLWSEILGGVRFMQQAALGKQVDQAGVDGLPTNMNPKQFERAAQDIEHTLEQREERRITMGAANDRMEDTWQGHNTHADSLTDDRASAAINAARNSDDVPTLDELAEESFSGVVDSRESESPQRSASTPAEF